MTNELYHELLSIFIKPEREKKERKREGGIQIKQHETT